MSVSQSNILMYGVSIPYQEFKKIEDRHENDDNDDWWDENYIGNIEDQNVGFLVDGMSGEYCLVGRSLRQEDSYNDPGLPVKIDTLSAVERVKVKEGIEEFLGRKVDELNYFFVSHYW